jgi:DnaJ-class molecular chaperone
MKRKSNSKMSKQTSAPRTTAMARNKPTVLKKKRAAATSPRGNVLPLKKPSDWIDSGNPQIEAETCESCGGLGILKNHKITSCPTCNGHGCVRDKEVVKVCPACKGKCRIRAKQEKQCSDCSGKGQLFYLVRMQTRNVVCKTCKGSQYVTKTVIKDCPCTKCGGSGKAEKKLLSLRMWEINKKILFQNSIPPKTSYCPSCGKLANPYCGTCEGDGQVIRCYLKCSVCEGKKVTKQSVRADTICYLCSGTGIREESRKARQIKEFSDIPELRGKRKTSHQP